MHWQAVGGLTQQIDAELVRLDVVEQGGEDGQQRHGHVVDALTDALHLCAGLHEFPQLQHLDQLLQVFRRVLEESPEPGFDQLRSGLHDGPEGDGGTLRADVLAGSSLLDRWRQTCTYLVSREWVRMSRQLTMMAESLPVRATFSVCLGRKEQQSRGEAYQREKSCA